MAEERWYPLGKPEWWKEFGAKEAKTWKDIGRYSWALMGGGYPWGIPGYAEPRYPMTTLEPLGATEKKQLALTPTLQVIKALKRWGIESGN